MRSLQPATEALRSPLDGYSPPDEEKPLGSYGALSAVFGAAFVGALTAAHRAGRPLPKEIGVTDVVLTGIATHKLSRLIAKDKVTSFLRAPFTEFQEPSGKGEIEEKPRGRGLRYATGELLVCPYCLAQWIAAGFAVGYVHAPRLTRLCAGMYTMYAISDGLQLAYLAAEERA
jgi:Protein of unknown function (DUF1360)